MVLVPGTGNGHTQYMLQFWKTLKRRSTLVVQEWALLNTPPTALANELRDRAA